MRMLTEYTTVYCNILAISVTLQRISSLENGWMDG